jgi:Protein of unknown function (DUF1761)
MDTVAVQARTGEQAPARRGSRSWRYLVGAALLPMVTSSVYYIITSDLYLTMRGIDPNNPPPEQVWPIVGQLARNAVVVGVLAVLMRRLRIAGTPGALRLGLLVWLGFQAMAVAGSVLHEQYPLGLYLLHIGDALQATLVMVFLIGLRQRGSAS